MKQFFSCLALAAVLGAGVTLQAHGPHHRCDQNHDGICDRTGKPVGECQQQGNGAAMRRGFQKGKAMAGKAAPAQRQDCGVGRGLRPCGANPNAASQPTPPAKK